MCHHCASSRFVALFHMAHSKKAAWLLLPLLDSSDCARKATGAACVPACGTAARV
jgi:hypothetical protein